MDNEPTVKKDVVPSKYREQYKETGGGNGDFIAKELTRIGKDGVASLNAIKKENGVPEQRWHGFNPGMIRMNLANVLRSRFLKGEAISILGKQYDMRLIAETSNLVPTKAGDTKALSKLADALEVKNDDRTRKLIDKVFFPPVSARATAEERAAIKAEKEKLKAEAKAQKDAEKAAKLEAAAKEKADKAAAREKAKADKEAAKKAEAEKKAKEKAAAKSK